MLWFTVRCYLEIDVGPRREGRFFVEIWVRSQAVEGRKEGTQESLHTAQRIAAREVRRTSYMTAERT